MDTPNSLSAVEVAQFLKANPDFFDAHADVFSKLMVPHPHQSRAISLGERQIMLLRERGKKTERQLATLVANARGNEKNFAPTAPMELPDAGRVRPGSPARTDLQQSGAHL